MSKETINIYLSKEDRKRIDIVKNKYQLSLTTIVDILCYETLITFIQSGNIEDIDRLKNNYLYERSQKTSIKTPRILKSKDDPIFKDIHHKSRFATNVILIYLHKDIKKYITDDKKVQTYWNKIDNKMTTTKDDWWAYNQHIRYERRSLKENKEYYQEQLDRMNHGKRD